MQAELKGNPDFGHIHFNLDSGDKILVESGAMAAMDNNLTLETKMTGGIVPAVMRKFLAGESLLQGQYTATGSAARLVISPSIPGHVMHRQMGEKSVFLTAGSFLACTPGVKIDTVFGGFQAIFSGEGMFFLKVSGTGDLWYNAYGSIIERELSGELIVDTGQVVGWEDGVTWSIERVGDWMSTFFSGEGLVMRFKGSGRVWLQTRNTSGLVSWIAKYF